jgi:hypothetical protein
MIISWNPNQNKIGSSILINQIFNAKKKTLIKRIEKAIFKQTKIS